MAKKANHASAGSAQRSGAPTADDQAPRSLRAQVASLRGTIRAEHAEMAQRGRVARAAFVHRIHTEVTQRIMPQVAQLRAEFRAEHAEMAERGRRARAAFTSQIRAWVG